MLTVMAFDPGKTTGIAVVQAPCTVVEIGEIKGERTDAFRDIVHRHAPNVVVVEAFRPHPNKAAHLVLNDLPASRMVGALEHVCQEESVPLVLQEASVKGFFIPRLLRLVLEADARRYSRHALDALSHALYYIWFTRKWADSPEVQELLKRYTLGGGRYANRTARWMS